MATLTGTNLLNSIIDSTGIAPSALLQASLAARLQLMIDAGITSKLSLAAAITGFSTEIAAGTEVTGLSDQVETNTGLIEAAADEAAVDALDFPDYGGEVPVNPVASYSISAGATTVTEGDAVTFTVTALDADGNPTTVTEETTLTYQVQGVETDIAAAATPLDDLGVLNGTVTFAADSSTATFALTPTDESQTEGFEAFKVTLLNDDNTAGNATGNILIKDPVNAGQTFTLTAGVDAGPDFTGGAGNDTFNAFPALNAANGKYELPTLNGLDDIDGGDGDDVLNATFTTGAAVTIPSSVQVANIETVNLKGDDALTVDTSVWSGTDTVNADNVAGDLALTVGSDTAVTVTGGKALTTVTGGKDVTVTQDTNAQTGTNDGTIDTEYSITVDKAADVTITANNSEANANALGGAVDVDAGILVGSTAANGATGAVNISATGAKTDGAAATLDAVTVNGGTTVSVTQTATSDMTEAQKDTTAVSHTLGAVTVTGTDSTTDVTIVQDEEVAAKNYVAEVTGVKATKTVTFVDMKKGEATTVDGLTFTASKDLTANEVATAFGDLTKSDTQDNGGVVANGTYTNALSANWTSGAASGATVVFSQVTANAVVPAFVVSDTTATGTVAVSASTAGKTAVTGGTGVLGVINGAVIVNDGGTDSITDIMIDGYGATAVLGAGGSLDVLENLTLKNSDTGTAAVTTTQTALNLTVDDVDAAVTTVGNTVKDLTLNTENVKSTFALNSTAVENVTINAEADLALTGTALIGSTTAKTVDINGSAKVNIGDVSTNVALTSFDASGNTGGVTATVEGGGTTVTGTIEEYVFSGGNDTVTVKDTDANNKIDIKVSAGAGDDKVTLSSNINQAGAMIDGGDDTDTLHMDAADAVTASASSTFEGKIDNFEKLSLGKATAAGTVDLDNMDDIDYVISASSNATAGAPQTESTIITFKALAIGQSVTVDGLTLTATAAMTDIEVAEAFDSLAASATPADPAKGTFSGGSLSANWASGDNGGTANVTFTSQTANTNVTDLSVSTSNAIASPAAPTQDDTTADQTEQAAVTFNALGAGDTVTVAGWTLAETDGGGMLAAEVEAAFATGATAKGSFGGTLTGWTVAGTNGNDGDGILSFTSGTADENVTNITTGGTAGVSGVNTTDGYAATTITFSALAQYQSVTVEGLTLTATDAAGMTAAEVAGAFDSLAASATPADPAKGTFSGGSLSDEFASQAAVGSAVEFRSAKVGIDEADFNVTVAGVAAGTAVGTNTTQGLSAADAAVPMLTLDNMADNGTVELVAVDGGVVVNAAGVNVKMTDATGDNDTLNVVTGNDSTGNGATLGQLVANSVENFNVTTTDVFTDTTGALDAWGANIADGKDDVNSAVTLTISGDKAKMITVDGAGDISLTTTSTVLEEVDGSGLEGKLTYTAGVKDVEVTGGSAVDTLTANANDVTLNGGEGNDLLTVNAAADRAILDGGAGNDKFVIAGPASTSSTYANILSVNSGDVIQLTGGVSFEAAEIELSAGATETTQALMDLAVNNLGATDIGWFETGGNTFIVMDAGVNSTAGFIDGQDMVVMITGSVDLAAASYNATSNLLEIG